MRTRAPFRLGLVVHLLYDLADPPLPHRGAFMGSRSPRQLSEADSVFLSVDSEAARSIIAGLSIVDASAAPDFGFERFLRVLAERTALVDRFRWVLRPVPFGLDHAWWVEHEGFNPVDHVQRIALPAPGGERELAELVSLLHRRPLDSNRPLWECWWIEGLEGGRVATMLRFHHCLMDGQSGVEFSALLFDLTAEPVPTASSETDPIVATPRHPTLAEMVRGAIANATRKPERIAVHAARALREGLVRMGDASAHERPPPVPDTHFNDRLSGQNAFAYTSIPLGPIREARKHFDAKVNDILLELLGSSLRSVLRAEGRLPDESVVALCPVSLRSEADAELDNQIASMPVHLATHLEDPIERLSLIKQSSTASKERLRDGAFEAMAALSECFVPGALRILARAAHALPGIVPLPANLVFSNVRGLHVPMYLAGARVEEIYPISMLQVANGMNVTAVSHDDQVDFGFVVDSALVPDPWRYADGIQTALKELEASMMRGESAIEPPDFASDSLVYDVDDEEETIEPLDLMLLMGSLGKTRTASRNWVSPLVD